MPPRVSGGGVGVAVGAADVGERLVRVSPQPLSKSAPAAPAVAARRRNARLDTRFKAGTVLSTRQDAATLPRCGEE